MCGDSLTGDWLHEARAPANRRVARALEAVWSRASAYAQDCVAWADEARGAEAEIERLTLLAESLAFGLGAGGSGRASGLPAGRSGR